MRMGTLITLAAILCTATTTNAADKADKPTAPIKSILEIAAALPKELAPGPDGWTSIQEHLVAEWAKKTFTGKAAQFSGKVSGVGINDNNPEKKIPWVVISLAGGKGGTITITGATASTEFDPANMLALSKLKPGDSFTFHGTISELSMRPDQGGLWMSVSMRTAAIGPVPK